MVDVVSRRCEEADCRRRPLYGHEGEKGRFCSYHKASDILLLLCIHLFSPLPPPSLLASPPPVHINAFLCLWSREHMLIHSYISQVFDCEDHNNSAFLNLCTLHSLVRSRRLLRNSGCMSFTFSKVLEVARWQNLGAAWLRPRHRYVVTAVHALGVFGPLPAMMARVVARARTKGAFD